MDFGMLLLTVPEESVGVATDDQVDIGHLLGHLQVFEVTGVSDGDQNVHAAPLQLLGFPANAFDLVPDPDVFRTGNLLRHTRTRKRFFKKDF